MDTLISDSYTNTHLQSHSPSHSHWHTHAHFYSHTNTHRHIPWQTTHQTDTHTTSQTDTHTHIYIDHWLHNYSLNHHNVHIFRKRLFIITLLLQIITIFTYPIWITNISHIRILYIMIFIPFLAQNLCVSNLAVTVKLNTKWTNTMYYTIARVLVYVPPLFTYLHNKCLWLISLIYWQILYKWLIFSYSLLRSPLIQEGFDNNRNRDVN